GVIVLFKWLSAVDGGSQSAGVALLNWLALASVVALFVACLWDKDSEYALRGLYWVGLIAAGMALLSFNPGYEVSLVGLVVTLSLYALATSALWRQGELLARIAAQLRMPSRSDDPSRFSSWLNTVNVLLGAAAYALTF